MGPICRVGGGFRRDGVALALVDTNGDGAQLMAEGWVLEDGHWYPNGSSTSFGSEAAGRSGGVLWVAGHAPPRTVVQVAYRNTTHQVVANEQGLWGWVAPDDGYDSEWPRRT